MCEEFRKKELQKMKHKAKQRLRRLETQNEDMSIVEIDKNGGTSAEYQEVEDFVMKNILPVHNWWPTVYKVRIDESYIV